MNILLTTGIYPPDIGGPATYIPQLAADLNAIGHKVVIVTLAETNGLVVDKDLRICKIKRSYPLPIRMFIASLIIYWELRKCEALFSNGLFLESAIALTVGKNRNSVVKIVGDPIWEKLRNRGLTKLGLTEYLMSEVNSKKRLERKIYNWSWSKFEHRTSPSLELCEVVNRNLNLNDCVHIPNGVEFFPLESASKSFDLITVSRLVNWKNIDIAIRVAASLNLGLLVIGDGPEMQNLRSLAKKLNARVSFAGQLTSSKILVELSKAKIFIQVSDYEGLSFSLLESMSLGLIPIVSNVSGNTSVVTNMLTGLVVEINEESLESAVKKILLDSKLADKISKNAMKEIRENYNGKSQRKKVIELLLP